MWLLQLRKIISKYGLFLLGIVLVGVSIFAALALLSYNAHDQSFLYYSDVNRHVYNKVGVLGAHMAAASFYLFGAGAYLLIPLLAYLSLLALGVLSFSKEWDRLLAGCVGGITSSVLLTLNGTVLIGTTLLSGGLVGYTVVRFALNFFEYPMVVLLFSFILLASLIVITRLALVLVPYYMVSSVVHFIQEHRLVQKAGRGVQVSVVAVGYAFYSAVVWTIEVASGRISSRYPELFAPEEEPSNMEQIAQDSFWNSYSEHEVPAQEHPQEEPSFIMHEAGSPPPVKEEALLDQDDEFPVNEYHLPDLSIFTAVKKADQDESIQQFLKERANTLQEKLSHFGIHGEVVSIEYGPVITLFEYKPNIDIKVSKILALEDDLALALQATSIRIIAPVPGKSVVGFEVANTDRNSVLFSEMAHSPEYKSFKGALPLILGSDTIGKNVIVDLLEMPHLLVAGSTGSGKSVALNTMLMSLLCKKSPDELRLILIDPKRLEFSSFADIAHLLFPIVTQPNVAVEVLKWVVQTMEQRYDTMAKKGVRNILEYHKEFGKKGETEMPFMVLVIDELADLMMTAGKHIEDLIVRVAQMARAAGIHMIVATQRPSVDVITGLIKVNFPSRVSFRVTSKVDSRTILDMCGAEKLLGRGDMLFMNSHAATPQRVHGAYVSNLEIEKVVTHIRTERSPQYSEIANLEKAASASEDLFDGDDALYNDIVEFLHEVDEVSISLLQRKFRIGYNRSARIMEVLEHHGHIISLDGGKMRKVVREQEQETME